MSSHHGDRSATKIVLIYVLLSLLMAVIGLFLGYGQRIGQLSMRAGYYKVKGEQVEALDSVELWTGNVSRFNRYVKNCDVINGDQFRIQESHGGQYVTHTLFGWSLWTKKSGPFFYVKSNGKRTLILRSDLERQGD